MTPHELNLNIQDFNEKQRALNEEKIVLTYLGAYWQRINKFPSLNKVLGKEPEKKKMTDEEMFKQVKRLNALFGGTEEVK
ncbi:hypothetical protein ACFFF5_17790 [Lederbergia wuyishanensis]|uniref:Uncharacterized protein n=1 Tax=Lederbergia wuyishanensis TaxID=1347903 RepID=A0ABU0D4F4_9BACI|nr:hypothetical protein [Lederbergia wuyishanensis]MCJ8008121.1 hypothetical protein [Lederbergia wuyishanensis]MDQ0343293.1 hypothetical protein [Lederbergia wuyishanensis]